MALQGYAVEENSNHENVEGGQLVSQKLDGVFTVEAETEDAARTAAIAAIKTAKIAPLRHWIVDLGSLVIEAADRDEAYREARKRIDSADDIEIDQIFEDER